MRKLAPVALAATIGALAIAATSAPADSPNAAFHIRDGVCGVLNANGVLEYVPFDAVENNNTYNAVCRGPVTNDTGKAVRWDDQNNPIGPGAQYSCANGTTSTHWFTVISASGQSTTKVTCPTSR